jgi:hypothetical protein
VLRAVRGPVLVLLAAREELLRESQGAGARAVAELLRLRVLTHLALRPLAPEAIRDLSAAQLGDTVADEAAAVVAARSEGNPFFAEELLRDYRERGLLRWRNGAWDLTELTDAPGQALPATLHLAIAVRLDRLPEECERALAAGAVLGRSFSARHLGAMVGSRRRRWRPVCARRRRRASSMPRRAAGASGTTPCARRCWSAMPRKRRGCTRRRRPPSG